jgi:selenocysteine-specific elongation factor
VRSIVIGTAGHIDHGKSALVRALTGTDPDRLKEERERGITIDLGFAHLDVGDVSLSFVDVPGHERFVKNMLAGAGGVDAVLLVVAADKGVMPQTREHFHICRLLNVSTGVIALTKIDLADADMRELAAIDVRDLTDGSFLANAPIVPSSARTGEGLDALRATLVAVAARTPVRPTDGPVRLPIDRVFSMKGFGTVVTGTLVSGRVREEQEVVVIRRDGSALTTRIRGLHTHGHVTRHADAGRRVAVNLAGVEVQDLARGDTLCTSGAFDPTVRVDVAIDLLSDVAPLKRGARVRFHHGANEVLARVTPATAGPFARLRFESPAVVTRGDRFILRAFSPVRTIGGGLVLDPQPPRGALRSPAEFERLTSGDAETLHAFIEERGERGFAHAALVSRCGLSGRAAGNAIEVLVRSDRAMIAGDVLVAPSVMSRLSEALLSTLEAHHRATPLSEGMPREEVRERLFHRAASAVFDGVLERLVSAGKISARDRIARSGHERTLSPEEENVRSALDDAYRRAHLTPLDTTSVAKTVGATAAVMQRVVTLLVRERTLIKVEGLLFHASALEGLKEDVRRMKHEGATRVDVASFKERFGVTRKYAIPLLEYLDRERITRRVGDERIVL